MRPEEIEQREFASSMRGFDRNEVRAFLKRVAGDVRDFERQAGTEEGSRFEAEAAVEPLSSTPALVDVDRFGALGDRIANLLRQAHESAAQLRESANEEAELIRNDAEVALDEARTEAARLESEAADLRTDAESVRAEAESVRAEAESIRAEAESVRAEAEQDAIEIRDQAEIDGTARLDDRQAQVDQAELDVAAERDLAMSELADARGQVGELLQEARAQSEFIRLESEEIIRAKVRTNMDQAQKRIDVLRNTESSSRDRIVSAQRELESALSRLESEPVPELGEGTEDEVLLEAEQRGLETNYGMGLSADSGEVIGDAEYGDGSDRIDADEFASSVNTTAEVDDAADLIESDVIESDVIESDVIESDVIEVGVVDEVETVDVVEQGDMLETDVFEENMFDAGETVEVVEHQELSESFTAAPVTPAAPSSDLFPAETPVDGVGDLSSQVPDVADVPEAPEHVVAADAQGDDSPAQDTTPGRGLFNSRETPVFGTPTSGPAADFYRGSTSFGERIPSAEEVEDTSHSMVEDHVGAFSASDFNVEAQESTDPQNSADAFSADDAAVAGGGQPENEDALARLVREAMQRAVESAKGSED